jgi:hypothetical protein
MTEQKRERGIKVLVKRKIRLAEDKTNSDGIETYVQKGEVITMSAAEAKKFGNAVTRDLPDSEDD